jgi:hypothetical protein
MSHWTWEYVPDAASVVGGLTPAQIDQVEGLAARIADAAAVRRIGAPFDVVEAVSNVKSYGEGPVMIWFLEDYRDDVVLVPGTKPHAWRGLGKARDGEGNRPWPAGAGAGALATGLAQGAWMLRRSPQPSPG